MEYGEALPTSLDLKTAGLENIEAPVFDRDNVRKRRCLRQWVKNRRDHQRVHTDMLREWFLGTGFNLAILVYLYTCIEVD